MDINASCTVWPRKRSVKTERGLRLSRCREHGASVSFARNDPIERLLHFFLWSSLSEGCYLATRIQDIPGTLVLRAQTAGQSGKNLCGHHSAACLCPHLCLGAGLDPQTCLVHDQHLRRARTGAHLRRHAHHRGLQGGDGHWRGPWAPLVPEKVRRGGQEMLGPWGSELVIFPTGAGVGRVSLYGHRSIVRPGGRNTDCS